MRPIDRSIVLVERPFDVIVGETESEHAAAVIEDDRVALARCRPQHPPDHLPKQPKASSRPRQDQARHIGAVPTLRQHHAIRDDFDPSIGEAF